MFDQHPVDEGSSTHPSEGIPKVQDGPEGSSPKNSSKLPQKNEEKTEKVETGKAKEKAAVKDDRDAEKSSSGPIDNREANTSRPDPDLKTDNDPSNYEEKYPEDKIYEEITAPNARVWKTFVNESKDYDGKMVAQWKDSVDLLLVFAGLFSAVVTTFVAQTSQSLQADYTQISASLLFEIVLIQRAVANGSSLDNIPVSPLNPYTKFTPATTDVWVNGLWFMSLSLSLAIALVAVLVKQWLHHYLALPSGISREPSLVRHYRYVGFQEWHVLVIIGLLPVLMHLALGIFFIGLAIFLAPLRPGFSWVIGVGTVVAYVTYLISIFLPILYPQCPYRTPLSDLVYFPYHYITQDLFPNQVRPFFMKAVGRPDFTVKKPGVDISSLDDLERGAVQEQSDTLSVEALHWLFSSSSNPTVHAVVIQSIGGLPLSAMAAVKTIFGDAINIRKAHDTLLNGCLTLLPSRISKPSLRMESKVERLLRFELFIPPLRSDWYERQKFRHYIEPADDKELALAVQWNNAFQKTSYHSSDSPTSTAFFHQMLLSEPSRHLPPVIWLGLMRAAKYDGAFDPIDIDSLDDFPLHLCHYVDPWNTLTVRQEPSSLVRFSRAVADNFLEEFGTNMLNMLSQFNELADKPSFPTTFTLTLASIRYLLHRISLRRPSSDINPKDTLEDVLSRLSRNVVFDELPNEQIAAFSDLMEYAIVHSSVFKQKRKWTNVQSMLVKTYSAMVRALSLQRPRHNYWLALRPLVKFLIDQYNTPYDALSYTPFDDMCDILAFGLRHGVQTVYDVFLETQCLDVFRRYHLRPGLVRVINGYVAGLAARHVLIDSQHHLDYLHKPENLFLAFCVLTTNGWQDFSDFENGQILQMQLPGEICRDIRALARLRPSDPSWDQCRRKLRDLQDDREEFFVKQQKWEWDELEDLTPEDIEQAKSNIHFAVEELDRFFSDWRNMKLRFLMHPHELISIMWRFPSRIYQNFRYPQHREGDEENVSS